MLLSKRAKIRVPNRLGFSKQNFGDLWSTLQNAIDRIYEERVNELSFEKIYRTVYTLVLMQKGPELYLHIESYLKKKLDSLKDDQFQEGIQGFELLKRLIAVWNSQCTCFKLLGDLMIYLDKVYCKSERKTEIYDLGLNIFKERVIYSLSEFIDKSLIDDINHERAQDTADSDHIYAWKSIIGMMETLADENDNYFLTHFEPVFLRNTTEFYQNAVNNQETSPIKYLEYMKNLRSFEFSLDEQFLNSDTVSKTTKALENVLIQNERFINIIPMLIRQAVNENDVALLSNVYNLSSVNEFNLQVIQCIEDCLEQDANSVIIDTNTKKKAQVAVEWTRAVIELSDRYRGLIENVITQSTSNGPRSIEEAQLNSQIVSKVLSKFLNQHGKRSIEFISLYLDSCFKVTHDKEEEKKVMQNLSSAVKLFNFLAEKDIFEMLYQQQLSKRLLQERSMIEVEKWMLQRIKDEVGTFFTTRLYGMLRDVSKSRELVKSFKDSGEGCDIMTELEFKPQVLTSINWPFKSFNSSDTDFYLPSRLEHLKSDFEIYYGKKYPERTLKWAYHLCQLEIGFKFDDSYHDISMSMFAATVFLLFEEHDELTTEMIGILTKIPEQELYRQLISLAVAPKTRLLKKKPMSKTINAQDKFSINYSFTAPTRAIKVQTVASLKPSSRSDLSFKSAQELIEQGRVTEVNASITRILKSNRHLSHYQLLELVTAAVKHRFTLSSSTFKRSLNYLIEKEYVQRDPDDATIYHYLP